MMARKRRDDWPEAATPSNFITVLRILLVPVFVAALLAPWPEWLGLGLSFSNNWKSIFAAIVFVAISCTDWLDGYLARSRNEVTDFGKFMDPLADKILVAAALISLVELGDLPTWVVLIILAREFIVSGVRMMAANKGEVIAASMIGKFKTVFQMIAIVLFALKRSYMVGTIHEALVDIMWVVSWLFMIIALILTIISMIDYLVKARDIIGLGKVKAHGDDQAAPRTSAAVRTEELATSVVARAAREHATIATAESLTGGMIGQAITAVAGASAVYKGGIVSYVNEVKHAQLGVSLSDLEEFGAVSEPVAKQMAQGALTALGTTIAVSVTGLAGPDGDEYGNPVGTVWIGLARGDDAHAQSFVFEGDRAAVRSQTVEKALELVADELASISKR